MAHDEASVFRALADPSRRQILQDLRGGELSAGEIASGFAIKAPSVSRHLAILKSAGLITERREANRILYSLAGDRLADCVGGFLSAVCPDQVVLRHRRASRERAAGSAP
jgi:DNA-binding transcriptional ArsR family regulator